MKEKKINSLLKISGLIQASGGLIRHVAGPVDGDILSVEYDSRKAAPGCLFTAIEGYEADGHKYIDRAVDAGASAVILSEKRAGEFMHLAGKGVAVLASGNTRKGLSAASAAFFGDPSKDMMIIGVTGTNGKTSITYMIESILAMHGISTGVIGTINYRWGGKDYPAPNTTPESRDIHELLHGMKNDGVKAVVIEVSSHALELNRADDIHFDAAIFTNLTRDHLDFHRDFENYFNAKRKIFDLLHLSCKTKKAGIVNVDDSYGMRIYQGRDSWSFPMTSYGLGSGAMFRPEAGTIRNEIDGLFYELESPEKGIAVKLQLSGRFHIYNSMAAVAAMRGLDVPWVTITGGISALKRVPGRFDVIHSDEGFSIVVDYAHTGDALLKLLQSVNELKAGRVITLFGCGGDRDRTKRPVMGRVAVENSDHVIVTSDNPRTEEREVIISEIIAGIDTGSFEIIPDREEAIARAVSMAGKRDIIVIAGKGHEDYQIIGREKIHFDDHEIANKYLGMRAAR